MNNKSQDCPWCKNETDCIETDGEHYQVWCPECGASGPTEAIEGLAIVFWNQIKLKKD